MLAIVAAAWLLREITDPLLPPGFPYVTFFPAVIVTSFLFGVRLGSVSALLCGLLAWYFFIAPAGFGLTSGSLFALAFYVFVVATEFLVQDVAERLRGFFLLLPDPASLRAILRATRLA